MSCLKCNSSILANADNVSYSCGHHYHIACILKTKLSIYKPTCPSCGQGNLICSQSNNKVNAETKAVKLKSEPQLIHYLIALILIIFVITHLLF
jgi:ribosomal protein S27AE